MSDLIFAIYKSQSAAFVAGENLAALQQTAGTEPEDIVVVSRDSSGRVAINQSVDLATGAPLAGGRWGALLGLMFLDKPNSQGNGKGLHAQFRAAGIEDRFLQDVGRSLDKGGGAVGMRVRLLGRDRVVERLKSLKGSPKILWTRLGPDAEEVLTDMQDQIPASVLGQSQAIGSE